MRGGESTLSGKARRERTAKAERKLLAKNSSMGSVRGEEAKGPSSQPRGRYCQDQEPVSGRGVSSTRNVKSARIPRP